MRLAAATLAAGLLVASNSGVLGEELPPLPGAGATSVLTVEFGGETRTFAIYAPPELASPAPVVFSMHGAGSSWVEQVFLSDFNLLADEHEFLVVYPQGTGNTWNSGPRCCSPANANGVDDVGFLTRVIEEVAALVPIDRGAVFANGMSNGGYMAARLMCDAPDAFVAAASVTGAGPWEEFLPNCALDRPYPYMHIHGTFDFIVPYSRAVDVVDDMRTINRCSAEGRVTFQNESVTCESWADGCDVPAALANTTFCTVRFGGHAWPGFPDYMNGTPDMHASTEIYRFYQSVMQASALTRNATRIAAATARKDLVL